MHIFFILWDIITLLFHCKLIKTMASSIKFSQKFRQNRTGLAVLTTHRECSGKGGDSIGLCAERPGHDYRGESCAIWSLVAPGEGGRNLSRPRLLCIHWIWFIQRANGAAGALDWLSVANQLRAVENAACFTDAAGLDQAGVAAGQRRNWVIQKASCRCLALLNVVIHFQWDIWAGAITSGMEICLIWCQSASDRFLFSQRWYGGYWRFVLGDIRGVNGVATCRQSSSSWYRFFKDIIRDGLKAVLVVALLSVLSEKGREWERQDKNRD